MVCIVSIVEHPEYLSATVTGDNTMESLAQYMREIREACIRLQKMKVLVVVSLVGPELPMMDVFQAVGSGSDAAVGLGMRVAYVDQNPERSIDSMLLAEDVAQGRGIPVRTFRDIETARRWLVSGEDP